MIRVSEDKELVEEIRSKLEENNRIYGKRYCPCVIPTEYNTDDNVCMCRSFREQKSGYCHCGLYYKE
jgi:ferredoxin-thioredoxin reductase catalytic subunit